MNFKFGVSVGLYWRGHIDDIRYYKEELSANQIYSLFVSSTNTGLPKLRVYQENTQLTSGSSFSFGSLPLENSVITLPLKISNAGNTLAYINHSFFIKGDYATLYKPLFSNFTVPAGAYTNIPISYLPQEIGGVHRAVLYISNNDPEFPLFALNLRGSHVSTNVGYYPLDNESDLKTPNLFDTIFQGQIINGAIVSEGKFSNGVYLYSGNSAITVPTEGLTSETGTILFYVKPKQIDYIFPNVNQYLLGHTTSPPFRNNIQIYIATADGKLNIGMGDNPEIAAGVAPVKNNEWHHMALVWNSGTWKFYMDGLLRRDGRYTGLEQIADTLDFGNTGSPLFRNQGCVGVFDEIKMFTYPLSLSEISNQMFPIHIFNNKNLVEETTTHQNVNRPFATIQSRDHIEFAIPEIARQYDPTKVQLAIVTTQGKLVYKSYFQSTYSHQWDGLTENQHRVTTGVYFLNILYHDKVLFQKMFVIVD